ncbi:helix-turn-helix domain-containing protein [Leifsonia virtsii]|uniref:helix-turn-helix domain-containing protein n=1 Tax=Leifsonia virtsii TaxID=3035915 RepID=UPI0034371FB3
MTAATPRREVLREGNEQAAAGLGERLRQVRMDRRLSQEDLAARAGLGPGTVARIEGGHQSPRVSTVVRLANVLEIPVRQLIDPRECGCALLTGPRQPVGTERAQSG